MDFANSPNIVEYPLDKSVHQEKEAMTSYFEIFIHLAIYKAWD